MFDYRRVSQSLMLQRCLWLCGQRLAAPTLNYARNFCNIHPFGFIIISLLKWQFLKQIRYQAQSFLNNIVIYCIYIIIYTQYYIYNIIYIHPVIVVHIYTLYRQIYIYIYIILYTTIYVHNIPEFRGQRSLPGPNLDHLYRSSLNSTQVCGRKNWGLFRGI